MTAEFHWDDARIFLAIARAGTLSGAADKMNMGIATVSRRLDRLEQALNVPLFSRHQSGYRLTDDGEALLARAEALEYAGLAFGEAAQLQGHVAGVVRLATSDNLATHFILPSLKGLLDHYPELRVEVLSGVQPVNLHRRDADLAIRMVKPEAGHLTLKRLGTVGFGVYGAADCLVGADGLSLSEADFVGWPETHQHLPAAQWITRTLRGRPCKVEANTLVAQVSAITMVSPGTSRAAAACAAMTRTVAGTRIWNCRLTIASSVTGAFTAWRATRVCRMKLPTVRWWINPGAV